MYTDVNFKTKKAFKDAVKNGAKITAWQPGPFYASAPRDGHVTLEGPHTWYASAEIKDGYIIKVK